MRAFTLLKMLSKKVKVKKNKEQKQESATEIKLLGPILTELSVNLHHIKFSGQISSYI